MPLLTKTYYKLHVGGSVDACAAGGGASGEIVLTGRGYPPYPWSMDKATALTILGLAPDATLEEARAAYRNRAKFCHPDTTVRAGVPKDRLESAMKEINLAYHFLAQTLPPAATVPSPEAASGKKKTDIPRASGPGFSQWLKSLIKTREKRPLKRRPVPRSQRSARKPGARFGDVFEAAVTGETVSGGHRATVSHGKGNPGKGTSRKLDYQVYLRLRRTMKQRRRFMDRSSGPVESIRPVSGIRPVGRE